MQFGRTAYLSSGHDYENLSYHLLCLQKCAFVFDFYETYVFVNTLTECIKRVLFSVQILHYVI